MEILHFSFPLFIMIIIVYVLAALLALSFFYMPAAVLPYLYMAIALMGAFLAGMLLHAKKNILLLVLALGIALLYQPLDFISFSRELWMAIKAGTIFVLLLLAHYMRR